MFDDLSRFARLYSADQVAADFAFNFPPRRSLSLGRWRSDRRLTVFRDSSKFCPCIHVDSRFGRMAPSGSAIWTIILNA